MIGRDWHADVNAYSLLRLKGWYAAAAVVAVTVAAVVADAAAVADAAVVAVAVAPVDAAVSNYLYPAIK